ncbi:hypothetical protein WJ972_09220 [Achromobacter insuavis]
MPARQDVAGKRPLFKDLALLPETAPGASRAEVLARFARLFGQH